MIKTEQLHEPLTNQDFSSFGIEDVAFVKPVTMDGQHMFAIHAADGTPLTVVAERELALATIRQHEMEAVSVH